MAGSEIPIRTQTAQLLGVGTRGAWDPAALPGQAGPLAFPGHQVGYQRRADHGADRQGCSDPERTWGFRSIDRSRDRQELGRREGGSRRRRRHGHTAGFDHRPPDQEVRRDWRLAGRPGPGNDGGRRGGEVVRQEAGQLAGRSRQRAERARPWGSHHASGHDHDAGAVIRTLWQSRRGCTVPEPGDGVGG